MVLEICDFVLMVKCGRFPPSRRGAALEFAEHREWGATSHAIRRRAPCQFRVRSGIWSRQTRRLRIKTGLF